MRVLICGDRNWANRDAIWDAILKYCKPGDTIIHGAARGADSIAGEIGNMMASKLTVLPFPADWAQYGKAAGPIRNQQMLIEGKPDEVWAFHDDLPNSKGTKDMVTRAEKAGVRVRKFLTTGEAQQ